MDPMQTDPMKIIYVCTSNTCRSPMAKFMARDHLSRRGLDDRVSVTSRGLTDRYSAWGSPADPRAVAALKEATGLRSDGHGSRALAAAEVDAADFLFYFTDEHVGWIADAVGDAPVRRARDEGRLRKVTVDGSDVPAARAEVPRPRRTIHAAAAASPPRDLSLDERSAPKAAASPPRDPSLDERSASRPRRRRDPSPGGTSRHLARPRRYRTRSSRTRSSTAKSAGSCSPTSPPRWTKRRGTWGRGPEMSTRRRRRRRPSGPTMRRRPSRSP